MSPPVQHVLLTGRPGCGKTTVVKRVIERMNGQLAGFYTQEVRHGGQRVGFEAVAMSGQTVLLAHVKIASSHQVGKYGVALAEFENLVKTELERSPESIDLFVIDEIGKMECYSQTFIQAVRHCLNGKVPVLATVALKGGGFISEVKQRPDTLLLTVTPANRDRLPAELIDHFRRQ